MHLNTKDLLDATGAANRLRMTGSGRLILKDDEAGRLTMAAVGEGGGARRGGQKQVEEVDMMNIRKPSPYHCIAIILNNLVKGSIHYDNYDNYVKQVIIKKHLQLLVLYFGRDQYVLHAPCTLHIIFTALNLKKYERKTKYSLECHKNDFNM